MTQQTIGNNNGNSNTNAGNANSTAPGKTEGQGTVAIEKRPSRMDILKTQFENWKPTLAAILPKHIAPDRVIKIAMNVYLNKPELANCTPLSMVKATLQCAELGLDPSPQLGEAYFVPFTTKIKTRDGNQWKEKDELQVKLMPGYVGLAKLVKQTGDVSDVYAVPVFDSEKEPKWDADGRFVAGFYVEEGTERKIHHIRNLTATRGELFAVYGVVKFKDGTSHFEVLSRADVEDHRKVSQQADGTAWKNNFTAMACKTAIRMAVKMVPKSPEKPLAKAIAVDEANEIGGEAFRFEMASDVIDTTGESAPESSPEPTKTQSRTDELNSRLGSTPPHDPKTGELK